MKREPGMAYDTKVLNKIFAVLSISFLLVTMWMFFDDYIRPWKSVQIKALDIQKQKIQENIKVIEGLFQEFSDDVGVFSIGDRDIVICG